MCTSAIIETPNGPVEILSFNTENMEKFNMSKGSDRRPIQVPRKKFDEQWDKIFHNPRKPKKEEDQGSLK